MKTTEEDIVAAQQYLSKHGGPEWVAEQTPILAGMFTKLREQMIDRCHEACVERMKKGLLNNPIPSLKPTEVKETRDDMHAGAIEMMKAIRDLKKEA